VPQSAPTTTFIDALTMAFGYCINNSYYLPRIFLLREKRTQIKGAAAKRGSPFG